MNNKKYSIEDSDLRFIQESADSDLRSLQSARILLTGCTGFMGKWLVEALLWANAHMQLGLQLYLLSRAPQAFLRSMPHLEQHKALTLVKGDVSALKPSNFTGLTHIIHGANLLNDGSETWAWNHIHTGIDGMRAMLELAQTHSCQSMLLLSSGAAHAVRHYPDGGNFDDSGKVAGDYLREGNVYGHVKYMQELMAAAWPHGKTTRIPIARCFTFMGAHMPLNNPQALGNFLRNALRGEDIMVQGDGTALRSYMYGADMVVWLLAALVRGRHAQVYNVGSATPVSIKSLAQHVASVMMSRAQVMILGEQAKGNAPSCYVPYVGHTKESLGLGDLTPFENALASTWRWFTARELTHV